jgi:hypothetical protein
MYGIQKSLVNELNNFPQADTMPASPDPCPTDPWLFTDPFARDLYQQRDLIIQLEEDIRTYVMFDGCWTLEELELKLEVRRLLREGLIAPKNSFGYLSPHPTVYCTLTGGTLEVSGQRYAFTGWEDLVFEPWLARYAHPGLNGPLQVGQLSQVSNPCLCCDAFPLVCIHCDKTRMIMRQILNYRTQPNARSRFGSAVKQH